VVIFLRVQRNEWLYKFTSLPADRQGIKYKEFEDESIDISEGCDMKIIFQIDFYSALVPCSHREPIWSERRKPH